MRRVLVPGTSAGLPTTGPRPELGEEVAAVFAPGGRRASPARVATRALVQEVRPLDGRLSLVRVRGCGLVRLVGESGGVAGEWAEVGAITEPGAGADALVEEVERALRRYLALRGEVGESAGGPAALSRDPVTASHEVASRLHISWPEVQDILEAGSAALRLRRERAVLEREAELLRRLLGREGA